MQYTHLCAIVLNSPWQLIINYEIVFILPKTCANKHQIFSASCAASFTQTLIHMCTCMVHSYNETIIKLCDA